VHEKYYRMRYPRLSLIRKEDKGYEDWLSEIELNNLKILFQKRHILAHNEGIVDDKYIKRSGDLTYKIDQRIVVTGSDIRCLVDLIGKLAAEIRTVTGE